MIDQAAEAARWQWALQDGERYIAGMAILPSFGRRGWFTAYPTEGMTAAEIRPMLRLFEAVKAVGPWDELRAWIVSDDAVAIRFAEWCGFAYDAGPATGFSPTGEDMTLHLWRRA